MLKILIFDHVMITVAMMWLYHGNRIIGFLTCCSIPNFIKIGSRKRLADAHICYMFNAQLLGNGRRHGNRITADMLGR